MVSALKVPSAVALNQVSHVSHRYNKIGYKVLAYVPIIGQIFNSFLINKLEKEIKEIVPLKIEDLRKYEELSQLIKFHLKADIAQNIGLIAGAVIASGILIAAVATAAIAFETFSYILASGFMFISGCAVNIHSRFTLLNEIRGFDKEHRQLNNRWNQASNNTI